MNMHNYPLEADEASLKERVLHATPIAEGLAELALKTPVWNMTREMLNREFGDKRVAQVGIGLRAMVARDMETNLFIKLYNQPVDALLQYLTMNTLHAHFERVEAGIHAVRHLALLESDSTEREQSVAIIEPAEADCAENLFHTPEQTRRIIKDVRTRSRNAIGWFKSRQLVNDFSPRHTGNIFIRPDGSYTMIDQPFYRGVMQAMVLGRLGAERTRELEGMMMVNPPLKSLPKF